MKDTGKDTFIVTISVSEGDRQYIIVQLLAEIKKLKEIMEVYIERQKKQREEHQKLLDELNVQRRRFQGKKENRLCV